MDFMGSYTLCEYFYMSVCIYVHYVCSRCLWRSDALELELSVVLSHHVGAGTCTYVLCKSSQCPGSSGAISQAPALLCLLPLIFVLIFVFPFPLLAPDLNCSIFLELSVVPTWTIHLRSFFPSVHVILEGFLWTSPLLLPHEFVLVSLPSKTLEISLYLSLYFFVILFKVFMNSIDFQNISKRAGDMARLTTKTNVNKIWYIFMGKIFSINIFMLE